MTRSVVVKVTDVHKSYQDFVALKGVSFELHAGQTMALLGHNGAGKSSLIKMILGLIQPSQGEIQVYGNTLNASQQHVQLDIGYLPENVSFYEKLSGYEVLSYFAALKGVNREKVLQILAEFGLADAQHRLVKTYSKGMRQRLGFAQAILSEPKLILLDEPTVGLDPLASEFMYRKINELKAKGCAVIICTHELSLVEGNVDFALIVGQGKVLAQGSLNELKQASNLKIKIKSAALEQHHQDLNGFQSCYFQGCLHVDYGIKADVIRHITQHLGIYDFSLAEPSLNDIYQYYINQLEGQHG